MIDVDFSEQTFFLFFFMLLILSHNNLLFFNIDVQWIEFLFFSCQF